MPWFHLSTSDDEQDVLVPLEPMDGREAPDEPAEKAGKSAADFIEALFRLAVRAS
jgi:hypothetical protein